MICWNAGSDTLNVYKFHSKIIVIITIIILPNLVHQATSLDCGQHKQIRVLFVYSKKLPVKKLKDICACVML